MHEIPIVYQGEPGANSEEAIEKFGLMHHLNLKPVPVRNLEMIFDEVLPSIGLALIPIENSKAGVVIKTIDHLLKHEVSIIGELYLPVVHNLMGWAPPNYGGNGARLNLRGKLVHSHWQAIDQCQEHIIRRGLNFKIEEDTAGSARMISEMKGDNRYDHLAIAHERAAALYGLTIFESHFQDDPLNTTHFVALKHPSYNFNIEKRIRGEGVLKATLAFYSVDLVSAIQYVLSAKHQGFKPETFWERPSQVDRDPTKVFNRLFYADFEIPSRKKVVFERYYADMRKNHNDGQIKLLGIYPAHDFTFKNNPLSK
ncbi:MAG: hypothetical protein A2Z88_07415 [Omnitrophica WOR_2 bacterium GWA2_47_8]|nr:MAG: hypothetical protein A2Z88_07415 [Omnitrophica WOR_2 bacterium GWA2_47_8]